jgi:hypothetical protein
MTWHKPSAFLQKAFCAPAHTADAGGCGERFESPGYSARTPNLRRSPASLLNISPAEISKAAIQMEFSPSIWKKTENRWSFWHKTSENSI